MCFCFFKCFRNEAQTHISTIIVRVKEYAKIRIKQQGNTQTEKCFYSWNLFEWKECLKIFVNTIHFNSRHCQKCRSFSPLEQDERKVLNTMTDRQLSRKIEQKTVFRFREIIQHFKYWNVMSRHTRWNIHGNILT